MCSSDLVCSSDLNLLLEVELVVWVVGMVVLEVVHIMVTTKVVGVSSIVES